MKRFAVSVQPVADDQILGYALYIEETSGSMAIAERWMTKVYAAIRMLETFPRRFGLAPEGAHRDYEIRALRIGDYLALYHVDDELSRVEVIGFRHGRRLPRPGELP